MPALMVLAAVGLASMLVDLNPLVQQDLASRWPRLFGAGAEGSRGMLSAIATSMVTVAGVVFSVTIVALSQASSQYSPRVLRNFMSDRPTQVVLGAFVSVFAYCLVVLRTIRGGDDDEFVPSLAVLGGVGMALVGIGLLIFFIHHAASAIQASSIIERIADDTRRAIDRLFPSEVGREAAPPMSDTPLAAGVCLKAHRSGYVLSIDADALLDAAARHDMVLQVLPRVGDFVGEGQPMLRLSASALPRGVDPGALCRCIDLGRERDVHQDTLHGLQQLVDVGLRALSPSQHDPTTATACIDWLGALLLRLTGRHIDAPARKADGRLRLLLAVPGYAEFVEVALGQLTHHAGPFAEVHRRLVAVVAQLMQSTHDPERRAALQSRLRAHRARLDAADLSPADSADLRAEMDRLSETSNGEGLSALST